MNSKTRDCIIGMVITFIVDMVMFAGQVYHAVTITETHLYITTGITLIFLAFTAGFLYYSRPQSRGAGATK
jgi:hypothetical protein